MFPDQLTDARYEQADDQVQSLLENCRLQRRALMLAAREAAGGDDDGAIARFICWIICADEQLRRKKSEWRDDSGADVSQSPRRSGAAAAHEKDWGNE